ncbi:NINE protein [Campylobacter fetus]|uniref:NINE protein n=1 Tax=Campylobacter fetus TaxID=196 RepID=UPI00050912E5|nr:TM2 domain-containing protein [Campylobacter fetus]HDX6330772.1 TM2 domain-containing protein [Campylobacter fetus subsp. venerealis]AIR79550.1 TM2 domain-containing protein [Campylobacter fetus subsp. fetus 04/554]EAJ5694104.1 TM2 domain-containing protein [Campylobacter fetus]EAJ5703678.1 TM2 domain-containing protein [Campylobacter fetus]EAJ9257516.1 TM2 domain-containing protein [Campylobacter fetus]
MDVSAITMYMQDKVPSQGLLLLQDKLKVASQEKLQNIALIPLKNPLIGLILGVLFGGFGVDRFYKGDVILGIAKLVLTIIGWMTVLIVIGYIFLIIVFVWVIADFFLVYKGIKQDNLNKIIQILA